MQLATLMPVLTLLQAVASDTSEAAQRNQAKWYLLLATIAAIGLLGVLMLVIFAVWRRAMRRTATKVRQALAESRHRAGSDEDPWQASGKRLNKQYTDDDNEQAGDDEPSQR
jgi:peptidoglycan/LPS O-acetylase OafA/YrhL